MSYTDTKGEALVNEVRARTANFEEAKKKAAVAQLEMEVARRELVLAGLALTSHTFDEVRLFCLVNMCNTPCSKYKV